MSSALIVLVFSWIMLLYAQYIGHCSRYQADLYFLALSCHPHPQSFPQSSLQTQSHCHHPEHLEGYCTDELQPTGEKRNLDSIHTLAPQSLICFCTDLYTASSNPTPTSTIKPPNPLACTYT